MLMAMDQKQQNQKKVINHHYITQVPKFQLLFKSNPVIW